MTLHTGKKIMWKFTKKTSHNREKFWIGKVQFFYYYYFHTDFSMEMATWNHLKFSVVRFIYYFITILILWSHQPARPDLSNEGRLGRVFLRDLFSTPNNKHGHRLKRLPQKARWKKKSNSQGNEVFVSMAFDISLIPSSLHQVILHPLPRN